MSFINKFLLSYLALEFSAGVKETKERRDAINAQRIVDSEIYQTLIAQGKTPGQITKILDLKKITPERFYEITGYEMA